MLKEYNAKRDFNKTSEPKGKVKKSTSKSLRFVIQYHRATTNHYDFRLEYNGVLVSFAVPKGLPKTSEKRLAVHVEDHPLNYINFEGVIPKGQYGAGTVEIYDKGKYVQLCNFKTGFKQGKLKFQLFGIKFQGIYNLIKIDDKNWIIIKDKINEKELKSKTKKTVKNPFNKVDVKLCLLTNKIPNSKNYIYEIKYDGYRIVAFLEKNKVVLKSRNNKDFTSKFESIKNSLKKLNKTMILDGEVVVFDSLGRSDFNTLQSSIKNNAENFSYVVFDILALDGQDLTNVKLQERKLILEESIKGCNNNIIYSSYIKNNGKKAFNYAKKNKLEGIVAKDINSVYNAKRDADWLKIKCYLRQEFVIIGFEKTNKNKKISSILVGYYKNKDLYFIGKVGTGFTEKQKDELSLKFKKLETKVNKIKNNDKIKEDFILIKPKMIAEIQFAEITKDGKLRQASFIGLREDKNPLDVKLESENERR